MNHHRPLKGVATAELELELVLRAGPLYKCQDSDCGSLENSQGKFDCCPACGKKGFLGGGFVREPESAQWKAWEARMIAAYRDNAAMAA